MALFKEKAGGNANAKRLELDARKAKRKRRLRNALLVLALLITVLPALVLAHPISYMPPIAIVLLVVVSFGYMQVLKRTLEYDEGQLASQCVRGDKVDFVVKLKNKSFLPHARLDLTFYVSDLFGSYDAATTVTTTLAAFENADFPFNARFTHLGTYSAGVSSIVVHDLLGLFSTEVAHDKRYEVNVAPRVFDLDDVDMSSVSMQESKSQARPITTDDMDYAGVREYQLGDPMKTVHWNLSSRNPSGELYTRLFEVYANPGLSIVIDPYAPDYDAEGLMTVFDGLVESAVSVDRYAKELGVDSELAFLDRHKEAASLFLAGSDSADELIRTMLPVAAEGQVGFDAANGIDLLKRIGNSTHGHGNIAFCTSRVNDDVISTLIEIRNHRRTPLLFVAVPNGLGEKEEKSLLAQLRRLNTTDIRYYVVRSNEDGTEVRGS